MNHLNGTDHLANRYHAMRHGQSKANEAGVIVSKIDTDRGGDYGLSERGLRQVSAAAQACGLPADTVIYASDFSRARQTAEVVREHLGAPEVTLAEALRERSFGDLEGTPVANYARVWTADGADGDHGRDGVEPADAVLDRTTALVADLERRYSGRDILLVSHGDTLQILQAGFLRMDPAKHRSVPHLDTAQIRELHLAEASSSPAQMPLR